MSEPSGQAVSANSSRETSSSTFRFGDECRLFATRAGFFASVGSRRFEFEGIEAREFLAQLLTHGGAARPDVVAQLDGIGALEHGPLPAGVAAQAHARGGSDATARVCVIADEPVGGEIVAALAELGIASARELTASVPAFVIAQVAPDTDAAVRLARDVYERGLPSLWWWERPAEVVIGPVVVPGESACWNCLRHRISDDRIAEPPAAEPDPGELTRPRLLALHAALVLNAELGMRSDGFAIIERGAATARATLHPVIPLPACAVCDGSALEHAMRPRAPARTQHPLEPFAPIMDQRTGIIRAVVRRPPGDDAFALTETSTAFMAAYRDDRRTLPEMVGAGKGLTRVDALMSAVGEGLERYSACFYDGRALRYASPAELGADAFDPRGLVLYDAELYADAAFPWRAYDEHRRIHWVRGVWLDDGRDVWLPALAVFMFFPAPRDESFCQVTSSGLGAGPTEEWARSAALYEALERDAFMITWLTRRAVVGVRIDDEIPPEVRALIGRVASFGPVVELYALDVGTEVTTIVCAAFGDGVAWPGATLGLGTHADPAVAVRKAVLEQAHFGPLVRKHMLDGEHHHLETPADVAIHSDHALYYIDPTRAAAFDFMRASRASSVGLSAVSARRHASLQSLAVALADRGVRVAAANVTSPDLREVPVAVARVLGTDLQPLDFGYAHRRLRSDRLARFATSGINPDPHPIA